MVPCTHQSLHFSLFEAYGCQSIGCHSEDVNHYLHKCHPVREEWPAKIQVTEHWSDLVLKACDSRYSFCLVIKLRPAPLHCSAKLDDRRQCSVHSIIYHLFLIALARCKFGLSSAHIEAWDCENGQNFPFW